MKSITVVILNTFFGIQQLEVLRGRKGKHIYKLIVYVLDFIVFALAHIMIKAFCTQDIYQLIVVYSQPQKGLKLL